MTLASTVNRIHSVQKVFEGHDVFGGPMAPYKTCPRGTFASEIGMSNCTACPKGSFALDAGSVECTPCPPGTEGPLEGMETCTRCSSGSYTPWVGSPQCFPCGNGQITPESGSTAESDCLCAEHSFMCEGEVAYPAQLDCIVLRVWGLHNSRVGFGLTQMFHTATSLSCVAEITWNALQDCWEDVRLGERGQLATTVRPAITRMAQHVSIAKREMCCRSFS